MAEIIPTLSMFAMIFFVGFIAAACLGFMEFSQAAAVWIDRTWTRLLQWLD